MYHNFWLAKPYGLANQKLYYIQLWLNIEISGEQGREHAKEWLLNTGPGFTYEKRLTYLRQGKSSLTLQGSGVVASTSGQEVLTFQLLMNSLRVASVPKLDVNSSVVCPS